jgi:uncharacterized protein YodC (DUF2158 family)
MSDEEEVDGLEVGDVVMLRSGGPEMTVTNVGEKDVCVSWATRHQSKADEYEGRINERRIPYDALMMVRKFDAA